jgi:hypothetical protein
MYPQLPQEEDSNIAIDIIIEDRLFDERFGNHEQFELLNQYNFEMMPYIDDPDDLKDVL